jgi:cytosine/adenosine deaminase-related metal-dependent hydrolase
LLTDNSGHIVAVGPEAAVPNPPDTKRVSWPNAVLLPGFVNLHTHLELTGLRGGIRRTDFFDWIQQVRQAKESITEAGFVDAAREGLREAWRHGTTAVADTGTSGATVRALAELGGRGVYFHEAIQPEPERSGEAFRVFAAETRDLVSRAGGPAVTIGVSPHAPYTVSPELYALVLEFARSEGLPLAAHIAESRAEVDLVTAGRGPFARAWEQRSIALPTAARSVLEYIDRSGLLGPDLLAIHVIHVDEADVALLRDHGVAVALCLRSNNRHGHGLPPLEWFREAGLRIGLGTDSVASVDTLDMLAEARAARDLSGMSASEALELVTLSGAGALGWDGEIGSLEPGKWADLCVVDVSHNEAMTVEQLAAAVLTAGADAIRATYVAGRLVFERTG